MAKDERLYAKFTLDFADHEKIMPLSDAAFRCLVEATLWSRRMRSDGLLARRLALAKWSPEVLNELCTNDTEKPSLIEVEAGWLIRDFADHQDTKAEIEARRERAKTAGQLGGLAKAKRPAKQTAKRTASKPLSKSLPETETETHNPATNVSGLKVVTNGGVTHVSSGPGIGADAPPPPCPRHPKPDHIDPCRACQRVREWRDGATVRSEQQRAQRERDRDQRDRDKARAIRRCDMCDLSGQHRRGNMRVQCPHDPQLLQAAVAQAQQILDQVPRPTVTQNGTAGIASW